MTEWNFGYGNQPESHVQRGVASVPTAGLDVTIAEVDLDRAFCIVATASGSYSVVGQLTASTTLHIYGASTEITMYWQVIELA